MAQDDTAPPTSRFVRAAGRVATIARRVGESYSVSWTPLIKWEWFPIGAQHRPWCPDCGAMVGGKFGTNGRTKGQIAHEERETALNLWMDKVDEMAEQLEILVRLLKPYLPELAKPGKEDSTDGTQDTETSVPAFYDDPDDDDPGEDS